MKSASEIFRTDNDFIVLIVFFQAIANKSSRVFRHIAAERLSQEAVMTVRVVMEREVEPGREAKFWYLMMKFRSETIKAKGCISGETLRAVDHSNKFLVLGNWNGLEDWKAWERDPERASLQQEIASLLRYNEKCTVFRNTGL
jgi:quinol monooxygenase YgiN